MPKARRAPGRPGKTPSWTPGSKEAIGKALNAGSHISFSITRGTLTESYYPREDTACMGESVFIVTDGKRYISDERMDAEHEIENIHPQVPGYHVTNTCKKGRYTISKNIIADPLRNCLLQEVSFIDHEDAGLRLHNITIPRFPKDAKKPKACVAKFNGVEILFSETEGQASAIACSAPFTRRSVGFLTKSDGLSQLYKHGWLKNQYELAEDGNLGLAVEINIEKQRSFLLVTSFGHSQQEAGHNALASLLTGFKTAEKMYSDAWKQWHGRLWTTSDARECYPLLDSSASVLGVCESKLFPGGILASLSIPWGHSRVEDGLGAYQLVWPRDLVLSSGGFAALNDKDNLLKVMNYLMTTQQEDGGWPQNMWLDGRANWTGIQLDQVAMPVSLVDFCRTHGLLEEDLLRRYWTGLKKALDFLIRIGPASDQDRWEEEAGITTFSLATQVNAYVAGANIAEHFGESEQHQFYLTKADELNARIEDLSYVTDTPLCKEFGVEGYYVRINPGLTPVNRVKNKKLKIKKPGTRTPLRVFECVSVDALSLVRFGLRAADDPKILNTIKIIDALLKVELPNGISWHRYVGDVYGEDEQGNPYEEGKGSGLGWPWPLLTGERAHYEIAAGNFSYAAKLLESMNNFASNGFLPEQVWDGKDIPEKGLIRGKGTGSARPLTWAHSEYIKLCRSLAEKSVFDLPKSTYERYAATA